MAPANFGPKAFQLLNKTSPVHIFSSPREIRTLGASFRRSLGKWATWVWTLDSSFVNQRLQRAKNNNRGTERIIDQIKLPLQLPAKAVAHIRRSCRERLFQVCNYESH